MVTPERCDAVFRKKRGEMSREGLKAEARRQQHALAVVLFLISVGVIAMLLLAAWYSRQNNLAAVFVSLIVGALWVFVMRQYYKESGRDGH